MQWTISFVTLVAGVVTIVWFIRDVRKENNKVLKAIEEGQRKGYEKLDAVLEKLGEMLLKQTEILARINGKLK